MQNNKLVSTLDALTGKLPKPAKGTSLRANAGVENVGKATGVLGTTIADPMTGAMNAKKVFLGSTQAKKIPGVKQLHSKMTEVFVTNPVSKSLRTGKGPMPLQDYILNPAVADAQRISKNLSPIIKQGSAGKTASLARIKDIKSVHLPTAKKARDWDLVKNLKAELKALQNPHPGLKITKKDMERAAIENRTTSRRHSEAWHESDMAKMRDGVLTSRGMSKKAFDSSGGTLDPKKGTASHNHTYTNRSHD